MALVIAGERSGAGKTTITLALLAALKDRQLRIQSFKVGPDYIDPMFHRQVTGRSCYNLDPVLTSEAYVRYCFARHSQGLDYTLIEGVMGLFDGATGNSDWASTAHIARLLNCPIVLVLDCSRLSRSAAAIAHGYCTFDPRLQIVGVILNRVASDRHLELLTAALEPLKLPIVGVVRRQEDIAIPDRHLGLVPTDELPGFQALIPRLAVLGQTFDWSRLLPWLQTPTSMDADVEVPPPSSPARIAVARDPAFNFYYADNLELLHRLGAEVIPWSPLNDPELPPEIQGLYLGGGFPEMFAEGLAANSGARSAVKIAIQAGLPTYAECGGLLYLCEALSTLEGRLFPMAGVLPTTATMAPRLTLGYRRATTQRSSSLVTAGIQICGHEFHHSQLSQRPPDPLFHLRRYDRSTHPEPEGWQCHHLHASYLHLHWGDRPELPRRFLQHCARWRSDNL